MIQHGTTKYVIGVRFGMIVFVALIRWVYVRLFADHNRAPPVTVQDFVDAARSGKWTRQDEATEGMLRMPP